MQSIQTNTYYLLINGAENFGQLSGELRAPQLGKPVGRIPPVRRARFTISKKYAYINIHVCEMFQRQSLSEVNVFHNGHGNIKSDILSSRKGSKRSRV
jgi:hypothetical protein